MKKAELKKLDNQSMRNEYEHCKRMEINAINDANHMLSAIDWLKIGQILYERSITCDGEKV